MHTISILFIMQSMLAFCHWQHEIYVCTTTFSICTPFHSPLNSDFLSLCFSLFTIVFFARFHLDGYAAIVQSSYHANKSNNRELRFFRDFPFLFKREDLTQHRELNNRPREYFICMLIDVCCIYYYITRRAIKFRLLRRELRWAQSNNSP